MILADTSVWADHFRATDSTLVELLARGMVLMHPLVIGELALGTLTDQSTTLKRLRMISPIMAANDDMVIAAIEQHRWMARGIGWVDAALLTSALLHPVRGYGPGTCASRRWRCRQAWRSAEERPRMHPGNERPSRHAGLVPASTSPQGPVHVERAAPWDRPSSGAAAGKARAVSPRSREAGRSWNCRA